MDHGIGGNDLPQSRSLGRLHDAHTAMQYRAAVGTIRVAQVVYRTYISHTS